MYQAQGTYWLAQMMQRCHETKIHAWSRESTRRSSSASSAVDQRGGMIPKTCVRRVVSSREFFGRIAFVGYASLSIAITRSALTIAPLVFNPATIAVAKPCQ